MVQEAKWLLFLVISKKYEKKNAAMGKEEACVLVCWTFKTNIGQLNKRNGWGNVKKRNECSADGGG